MGLIHGSSALEAAREAVVLDLGDLARQAEGLRERARAQADKILKDARAERDRLVAGAAAAGRIEGLERGMAEGREKGRAEGKEAALTEFRERLAAIEKSWASALDGFETSREDILADARHDVLRLAVLLAEQVVKRVVRVDAAVVADQIAAVVSMVARPSRLLVTVNPVDKPEAIEALPEIMRRISAAAHVELEADPNLEPGSCVARTPGGGAIDASIRVQLARIAEALLPGEELLDAERPAGVVEPRRRGSEAA